MKHPDVSDWMAYLYGESTQARRADWEAHLAACPECAGRVGRWRRTMGELDTVGVSAKTRGPRVVGVWMQRAAAAAIVLGIGFALGRTQGISERDLETRLDRWRDEVTRRLANQRAEDLERFSEEAVKRVRDDSLRLLEGFAGAYRQARLEDRRDLVRALWAVDRDNAADTARLTSVLADLASSTGTGFEEAQMEMNRLATRLARFLPTNMPEDARQEDLLPATSDNSIGKERP